MQDTKARLRELAERAGLGQVPPKTLAAGAAVCAVGVLLALWRLLPTGAPPVGLIEEPAAKSTTVTASPRSAGSGGAKEPAAEATSAVFVHVVGAVARPGLYRLAAGARLAEALSAAGGLLPGAEERSVNLARIVSDGEQILVPTREEYANGTAGAQGGSGGGSAPGSAPGATAPVNINTADATALDGLPGIGPSTAAKIVADREANGPFSSPEDLGRVSGIGPKKLETLLSLIVAR